MCVRFVVWMGLLVFLPACGAGLGVGDESAPSADASLADLLLSAGRLDPAFDPDVTSYVVQDADVPPAVAVTPFPSDEGASISINGLPATPGDSSEPIDLGLGMTPITIDVTAQDGRTQRTYVVLFERTSLSGQEAYVKASNTGSRDSFGLSLAIDGNILVVGATQEDSAAPGVNGNEADDSATGSGAAYVFVRSDGAWMQEAYLKASSPDRGDNFGWSVAVSGTTVVVSALFTDSGVSGDPADNSMNGTGSVYVFTRTDGTWTQEAYLKASNPGEGDSFGESVAISGDTIVVGAPDEESAAVGVNGDETDNSARYAGAAYVFVRTGTTWAQQAYLKASNTDEGDRFGISVAISRDTLVVGAWGESSAATGVGGDQTDNSAPESGAAYVFVRRGSVWTQQAYLKASNSGAEDQFGRRVAIADDTVLAGAYREDSAATEVHGNQNDDSASDAGAAYVYVRNGATWSQQAYLKADTPGFFGHRLALADDTAVVGAIDVACVFVRVGRVWTQRARLTSSVARFGESVAVAQGSNAVVVGSRSDASGATGIDGDEEDDSASGSGACWIFR